MSRAITQASISSPLIVHFIITPFPIQILLQGCGKTQEKEAARLCRSSLTSLHSTGWQWNIRLTLKSHYCQGIFLLLKRPLSKDTLAVRGPSHGLRPLLRQRLAVEFPLFQSWNIWLWNPTRRRSGIKKSGINLWRLASRLHGGPGSGGRVALSDQRTCGSVFQRRDTEAPTRLPLPPGMQPLMELRALEGWAAPLMVDSVISLSECGRICTTIWFVPQPEEHYEKNVTLKMTLNRFLLDFRNISKSLFLGTRCARGPLPENGVSLENISWVRLHSTHFDHTQVCVCTALGISHCKFCLCVLAPQRMSDGTLIQLLFNLTLYLCVCACTRVPACVCVPACPITNTRAWQTQTCWTREFCGVLQSPCKN